MNDNLARKIEYNPNEEPALARRKRPAVKTQSVRWSGFEKMLVLLGTVVTLGLMTLLVSASVSATAAQHELTSVEQLVSQGEGQVSDLHQELGELTSSDRLNRIARNQDLSLNDKNIRTIH